MSHDDVISSRNAPYSAAAKFRLCGIQRGQRENSLSCTWEEEEEEEESSIVFLGKVSQREESFSLFFFFLPSSYEFLLCVLDERRSWMEEIEYRNGILSENFIFPRMEKRKYVIRTKKTVFLRKKKIFVREKKKSPLSFCALPPFAI